MKEIPILFSTPMVQAILDDRKTMTRRIVKFRNKKWRISYEANEPNRTDLDAFGVLDENGNLIEMEEGTPGSIKELGLCPYGQPGDLLYVRESFLKREPRGEYGAYGFKADFKHSSKGPIKWRPSIHMPKEAARIWLQVTDVRVERLQDITEVDAITEGVQPNCEGIEKCPSQYCQRMGCQSTGEYYHYLRDLDDFPAFSAKESFESLWQSINGAESWEANPWVWVISFKVLSTTGKPDLQSLNRR